jgi:hypothetical protein
MAKASGTNDILLIGDLNSDPQTFHGQKLVDFSNNNNMHLNVHEPTRITATSSTILDQIITSRPNLVTDIKIEPPVSTNDHCTVTASLNLKPKTDSPYERLMWNYKKADTIGLKDYLREADWNSCFLSDDVNIVAQHWSEILLNGARQFIPNRMVLVRPRDKPWYSNELRNLKRKVLRMFNRAKSTGREDIWDNYKQMNNDYHERVQLAKKQFELKRNKELKSNHKNNPKLWWRTVKQLLGFSRETEISTLLVNGVAISDSCSKAEILNNYFASHSDIDTKHARLPVENQIADAKLENICITENDVNDILKSLDTNKAYGVDGISPRLLKMVSAEITPSLTKLFNMSLHKGIFPDIWKQANVMPLFKKGKHSDINNYRPVSLLSSISKVFEKVVFKYMFNFFRTNLRITIHQSGFLPGDSTINQLVYLYNCFAEALDKKKDIHVVFCDISKAFDRVWHEGLLYKLQRNGIDGSLLAWCKNYLKNRKQRVLINGQHSNWKGINAGVPQGSVLGPLMFLIYINDIVDNISGNIKLYADDTALFIDVENTIEAEQILNEDLAKLKLWSDQWLVNFNAKKTVGMKISLKRNTQNNPDLYMNDSKLEIVDNYKHLGLQFNKRLNWRDHVLSIVTKGNRNLDVLKRLRYSLDRKTLETLYMSFIRPSLEYGSVIWDNCDEESQDMLEKVQLNAAKIITGAIKGTSHNSLYQECGWESLRKRRQDQKLILFHKMIHGNAPAYLCNMIPPKVGEIQKRVMRNADNYVKPLCRTEQYRSSFLPDVINSWNNLPRDIRNIENEKEFKHKLFVDRPQQIQLYYFGNRFENIIHSRIRMHCSCLKDHLHRLHVIENPICSCQLDIETAEHYFLKCPLYAIQRNILFDKVEQTLFTARDSINIDLLLYGHKDESISYNKSLFEIVHAYINATHRFEN